MAGFDFQFQSFVVVVVVVEPAGLDWTDLTACSVPAFVAYKEFSQGCITRSYRTVSK